MRGKFYNVLSDDDIFKMMFSGKFVTKVLPEFVLNNKEYSDEEKQQKLDTLKLFKGFTTSLVPFFNNRENIFSKSQYIRQYVIEQLTRIRQFLSEYYFL